ncbi:helix-turn-helix domain-containing protein [Paenibacillus sp. HB172176]|uniref:helix-turn-helix domain-containing protein n=1 Tax=Paenibacillus sp. HB172176 TaxID=2493690 RepID=UPI001438FC8B|nr:helix-turn-helix domain-containing protein [Paenibacillus sp. HB172176]
MAAGGTYLPGNGIIAGHFRENDHYLISRPEGMNDWLLLYTIDGEGYFHTPAGERSCGEGDMALLRKGTPHSYGTKQGRTWHFMWAHFEALPEVGLLPVEEVLICPVASSSVQRQLARMFRSLLQYSRDRSRLWQELCENQLSGMLLIMAEHLTEGMDPRVSQVMRLLSSRMQEQLSLEELAEDAGLSVSRLSHLFKQETGSSILDTLNGMRLDQAAMLMTHAGRTATEAAFDVGFQSYNHFAALFRRRFNRSPSRYRDG